MNLKSISTTVETTTLNITTTDITKVQNEIVTTSTVLEEEGVPDPWRPPGHTLSRG